MLMSAEFPSAVTEDLVLPAGQFICRAAFSASSPVLACAAFDSAAFSPHLYQHYNIPCPMAISGAARKRQAEYLASRWLVRSIAASCGIKNFILTNNPDRSPRWPTALTASLSHTGGMVFLLADPQKRLAGNDTEQWMCRHTASQISGILMDEEEEKLLASVQLSPEQAVTLLFSLKESLYKALWPQVRQYIDFLQVRLLAIDEMHSTACLQLKQTLSQGYTQGRCFTVSYAITRQRVFSWISH